MRISSVTQWPTHKARARQRNARHRAAVRKGRRTQPPSRPSLVRQDWPSPAAQRLIE